MSPGSTLIASLRYRDAPAAAAWLERVLGMERHAYYELADGSVAHAELRLGGGMVMLGSASNFSPYAQRLATPEQVGGRVTSVFYVQVPDCVPVWERVLAAEAEVLQSLREMEYGGKAFSIVDSEGYIWGVGEYDPWKKHDS